MPVDLQNPWFGWIPFGQNWSPLTHQLIAGAVVLTILMAVVSAARAYVRHRRTRGSARKKQFVENIQREIHGPLVQDLSIEKGQKEGMVHVLNRMVNEWNLLRDEK